MTPRAVRLFLVAMGTARRRPNMAALPPGTGRLPQLPAAPGREGSLGRGRPLPAEPEGTGRGLGRHRRGAERGDCPQRLGSLQKFVCVCDCHLEAA